MKTGIIDVGGGLRGIYGAGVLDRCMDEGIAFDVCVGVSAGSANMAAFLAGQRGRNYRFYASYPQRPAYMGLGALLHTGSYIDLDYVYGTLSNDGGEDPLDYEACVNAAGELFVVATDAVTGEAVYFTKADLKPNDYKIFNASCAMPVACRPQTVAGRAYYDGGVSDPVPVKKALSLGCEKLVLILTRPLDYDAESRMDAAAARILKKSAPAVSQKLTERGKAYREGVARAKELQTEGRCLILAPDDLGGVGTVTRDSDKLFMLYGRGYRDAGKIASFLRRP